MGFATAKILSQRGATVCIADVNQEAMKDAEAYFAGLNVPHLVTKVDVSKRAEVDSWIGTVVQTYGETGWRS